MEFINFRQRRLRRRRKRFFKLLVWIFIGIIGIYFFGFRKTPPPPPTRSLSEMVGKALEGSSGTYAVAVKNLKTGESFFKDEQKKFEAGSLYKLWVMAVVINKMEKGDLKEDQVLSQDISVLLSKFNINPEPAEQSTGVISLTVNDALKQMITISHNYAALLLTDKVKLSTVSAFLKERDFKESSVGVEGDAPSVSAFDMALFLEKLYKGELANQAYTSKMLDLLKGQQLNDKLPKLLPPGTIIAHKTGEIGWFSHDAGIVYAPKGDYIIVVLSESNFPEGAEVKIAEVSKAVYEYFVSGKL